MPGPVSDSYDPEFSTGANRDDVCEAIKAVVGKINKELGTSLKNIVEVAQSKNGKKLKITFTEKELRIIRFSLIRAIETI